MKRSQVYQGPQLARGPPFAHTWYGRSSYLHHPDAFERIQSGLGNTGNLIIIQISGRKRIYNIKTNGDFITRTKRIQNVQACIVVKVHMASGMKVVKDWKTRAGTRRQACIGSCCIVGSIASVIAKWVVALMIEPSRVKFLDGLTISFCFALADKLNSCRLGSFRTAAPPFICSPFPQAQVRGAQTRAARRRIHLARVRPRPPYGYRLGRGRTHRGVVGALMNYAGDLSQPSLPEH